MKKLSLPVREYNLAQIQYLVEKRVQETSTCELVKTSPYRQKERGYTLRDGYMDVVRIYRSALFMPKWVDQETEALNTVLLNDSTVWEQRFEGIRIDSQPVVLIDFEEHVAEGSGLAWENRYPFKNTPPTDKFPDGLPDITEPHSLEELQTLADYIFEVASQKPNRLQAYSQIFLNKLYLNR